MTRIRHAAASRLTIAATAIALAILHPSAAGAQIKAQSPRPATPAWDKGIQPIGQENYWNAVACGKQGGDDPPCVFWDTGLCKNADFTLAMYTPYKMVAYEVWRVVKQRKPAPTPDYAEAKRTRVNMGVTAAPGSKNPITAVSVKRGGRAIKPTSQSLDGAEGRFTFDFTAFAPTSDITIELVGRAKTQTCTVAQSVLSKFR